MSVKKDDSTDWEPLNVLKNRNSKGVASIIRCYFVFNVNFSGKVWKTAHQVANGIETEPPITCNNCPMRKEIW